MSIYKFCISTPIWKLKTTTYVFLNCQLGEVIPDSIQRSNLIVKLEVHTTSPHKTPFYIHDGEHTRGALYNRLKRGIHNLHYNHL
jgi:hypothetical protein